MNSVVYLSIAIIAAAAALATSWGNGRVMKWSCYQQDY